MLIWKVVINYECMRIWKEAVMGVFEGTGEMEKSHKTDRIVDHLGEIRTS